MNPTRTTMWRCGECGECGELHDCEDAALSCCSPAAEEVKGWACSECGYVTDDEEVARYCCLDEDVVLPPTPAQLEAAGQLRLFQIGGAA